MTKSDLRTLGSKIKAKAFVLNLSHIPWKERHTAANETALMLDTYIKELPGAFKEDSGKRRKRKAVQ